ncbi:NodGS [Arabidopsis thaliana]|uniref:NodGS n=1 Tax=Arabidopsis thaliana TaxID=3702 RepID=A0A178VNQ1_ARATH|nr:NodGS [Arabidopsis thaliana]
MEFSELKEAIEKIELVDAHAHNIVSLDSSFPFIGTFSEAAGDALTFAPHSLSFKRNLREIAQLYGTEVSLEAVEEHRKTSGLDSFTSKCFKEARISALLIDDGLKLDKKHDIEWHRNFVPFVGRVLRIETLAEQILEEECPGGYFYGSESTEPPVWDLDSFTKTFYWLTLTTSVTLVPEIVALKTIAAYRSGLDIDTYVSKEVAENGLVEVLRAGKPVRIGNKGLIDYILTISLEVAVRRDLPLQIHTGFGDKDLDLRLSNPLHLRTLLEDKRFGKCRIVLLHAAYPFSKEASFLSSVYPQVYLDFGLAVPKLSVHGMVSSVKELLDLASIKKVMFSTDGYASPETYYLGAKKAREVIFLVLSDACASGDLSLMEAIDAAKDIFSRNSIGFYKLNIDTDSSSPQNIISPKLKIKEPDVQEDSSSFVRIIWVDTSGQQRCRAVQAQRFNRSVKKNGVGLTFASMGMTSFTDGPAEESKLTGVGEIRLVPDLSTKQTIPWTKQESMVLADMQLKPGEAWEYCPRETLRRVAKVLKDEFDLVMNAGFENEFYLLKNVVREGKEEYMPFDFGPYCATSSFDAASPIFHDIVPALESLNIEVEQFHAESGKGQFEVSLGHTIASHAADNLVYTREVIRSVARKQGLLATFVPKYDYCDIGSGSHVHLSLWKNGENVFPASNNSSSHGISSVGEEFMAGVLFHLPSILAIIAPLPNSYDRIQPNTWSGAFQCWGKENREAALRAASPPGTPDGLVTNFEIKSFDGSANPHLGLAVIMAAGIDGLRRHLQLPTPIDINPADVAATLNRLPETLSEAVEALDKDKVLHDLLGQKLLVAIKGVRKAEVEYYSKNPDAYKQLIHRY